VQRAVQVQSGLGVVGGKPLSLVRQVLLLVLPVTQQQQQEEEASSRMSRRSLGPCSTAGARVLSHQASSSAPRMRSCLPPAVWVELC